MIEKQYYKYSEIEERIGHDKASIDRYVTAFKIPRHRQNGVKALLSENVDRLELCYKLVKKSGLKLEFVSTLEMYYINDLLLKIKKNEKPN